MDALGEIVTITITRSHAATVSSSSTLVPVPTVPSDPNFGHLRIINDVLYPKGEEPYSGWDLNMRIALFIITQATPIVAAALLIFSRNGWWKTKFYWTMARLMVLWLVSVQIFGAIVYVQKGATTRTLFIAGALHLQIEYVIIALLLKTSALKALVIAYIGGTILYMVQLFVKDLSIVYIITTIAGFSDFLIPILLAYGKQWLFAIGGFAHLAQAISIFCAIVKNYGHFNFDLVTFLTTWIMNGALVAAVFQAWRQHPVEAEGEREGLIHLPHHLNLGHHDHENGDNEHEHAHLTLHAKEGEASDNPLSDIVIPKKTLYLLFGVAIVGSIISANVFTFLVARN